MRCAANCGPCHIFCASRNLGTGKDANKIKYQTLEGSFSTVSKPTRSGKRIPLQARARAKKEEENQKDHYQEEKNRKTARDAFEQELDILEEFTEKRVASNEKINLYIIYFILIF